MADPRLSQNAARLSEEIGDVLSAIRRMIADDEALAAAHAPAPSDGAGLVQDDAGEFLARRYGGNAALARRMVESAGRPALNVVPAAAVSSLRPDTEQPMAKPEAPKPSGWRAGTHPAASGSRMTTDLKPAAVPTKSGAAIADIADDGDDFAEAFDWKARMRPESDMPIVAAEAKSAEQRQSGWVLPSKPVRIDQVAQLAAEAEAFDADAQAQAMIGGTDHGVRDLVRRMVREELNGELGQKFSANLRAVIRREVAAAIDAQMDRF